MRIPLRLVGILTCSLAFPLGAQDPAGQQQTGQPVTGKGLGAGPDLGLPERKVSAKRKKQRAPVLPGARPRQDPRPGPRAEIPQGDAGELDAFLASLASTKPSAVEKRVAAYTLLPEAERLELRRRAYELGSRELAQLAKVYRIVSDPNALPLLAAVVRTRKLGPWTAEVVDDLLALSGDRARGLAFDLLESGRRSVRRAAETGLVARLLPADLPRLEALLAHEKSGTRQSALRLTSGWLARHLEAGLDPLLAGLTSEDGSLRRSAAEEFARLGERAVPILTKVASTSGTRDEAFLLVCWLLSRSELLSGESLLGEAALARLERLARLGSPLAEAVAAIVGGHRQFLRAGSAGPSTEIARRVTALVKSVEVKSFYPEFPLCQDAALLALRLLSGRDFGVDAGRWSAWWKAEAQHFVPFTRDLALGAADASSARLLAYEGDRLVFAILGRRASEPAHDERPGEPRPVFVRVGDERFATLVRDLRARGFLELETRLAAGARDPRPRLLRLISADARVQDEFASVAQGRGKALHDTCVALLSAEGWQSFVPAGLDEAGRRAWWARESSRLAGPAGERRARLVALCLASLPSLEPEARARAFDTLTSELRTVDEAERLLACADGLAPDELERLLGIAARVGDARVFVRILDILGAQAGLLSQPLFARLLRDNGVRHIGVALGHASTRVRSAAAFEMPRVKDEKQYPALIALLADEDPGVRASAARACGVLGLVAARGKLVAFVKDAEAEVRRAALVAVAAAGVPDAFALLQEATARGDLRERLAAVRGLGLLRDPRVGESLVLLAAAHWPAPLGLQAIEGLAGRGGSRLRVALRKRIQAVERADLRRELLLLLGEMHDPIVVPEMLRLLEGGFAAARSCRVLAGLSGLDFCDQPNAAALYKDWWEQHASDGASSWLLQALAKEGERTSLSLEVLLPDPDVAVVDELCRIVEKAKTWPLRSLAAHLLREFCLEDYGGVGPRTELGERQLVTEQYRTWVRERAKKRGR